MTLDGAPEPSEPGRIHRIVDWSKARSAQASAWAYRTRDDHATIDIGFRMADRNRRTAAMVLAGGIAYRVFFWLLAVSLIAGGVLGLLDPNGLESSLEAQGAGSWLSAAIANAARAAEGNEWWLILVGGWLTLWTGYTCTKALVLTHAAIWQQPPPRVTRPLHATLVFNGLTLAFILAMGAARWVRENNSSAGVAATLLVILVPFQFWLWASRLLPNQARSWRDLAPGAAVIAVGLEAMHMFTVYFFGPKLTSATQLYGVIGVATTILFWFYLAGRLIIGAATLNSSFVEHRLAADESKSVLDRISSAGPP